MHTITEKDWIIYSVIPVGKKRNFRVPVLQIFSDLNTRIKKFSTWNSFFLVLSNFVTLEFQFKFPFYNICEMQFFILNFWICCYCYKQFHCKMEREQKLLCETSFPHIIKTWMNSSLTHTSCKQNVSNQSIRSTSTSPFELFVIFYYYKRIGS